MRAGEAPDLAKTRHRSKHTTSLRYSKSPKTGTRSRKFVRSSLSCLGSLFGMRPIKEPPDLGDAKSGAVAITVPGSFSTSWRNQTGYSADTFGQEMKLGVFACRSGTTGTAENSSFSTNGDECPARTPSAHCQKHRCPSELPSCSLPPKNRGPRTDNKHWRWRSP
jgi:hypothetical protein